MSIRGHDNVGDEVSVAVETTLGDSIASLIATEVPQNEGLI